MHLEETMKSMKHGFLAAAAAAALIAGATGVQAQAEKKLEAQSGAQVGGGAEAQKKGAQTGTEARGGVQAQGGAKTDMKTGQGGAQTEVQGGAKTGASQDSQSTKKVEGRDTDTKRTQSQPMDQSGQKRDSAQGTQSGSDADVKASVQLNEQQRTRISQTIKQKDVNVRRIDRSRINFTINVGAVVPRTVELYPLPAPILAVVPAYRGYLYIVVGDDLLIIHPRTYEIVAVIPA
jgi:hypothetical protein